MNYQDCGYFHVDKNYCSFTENLCYEHSVGSCPILELGNKCDALLTIAEKEAECRMQLMERIEKLENQKEMR